jgi:hypothetical protein
MKYPLNLLYQGRDLKTEYFQLSKVLPRISDASQSTCYIILSDPGASSAWLSAHKAVIKTKEVTIAVYHIRMKLSKELKYGKMNQRSVTTFSSRIARLCRKTG